MLDFQDFHADNFEPENGDEFLKATVSGVNNLTPQEQLNYVRNIFDTNPDIKEKVKNYVAKYGYDPSDSTAFLAAQFHEARKTHIKSNASKFEGSTRPDTYYNDLFTDSDEFSDDESDGFTPEALDDSHADILANEAFYSDYEEAAGTIDSGLPDTKDERKKQDTATLIGSIIGLGAKVINDVKEKKNQGKKTDFNALLEILKKRGKQQITETKTEITEREKNRYIEDQFQKVQKNLPLIIGGVVVAVITIFIVAKKK